MKPIMLVTTALIWGCAAELPSEPPTAKKDRAEQTRYEGILKHAISVFGGDTPVTVLKTDAGEFELDLNDNKELKAAVSILNNKRVVLTGKPAARMGEEAANRRIILVSTIKPAGKNEDLKPSGSAKEGRPGTKEEKVEIVGKLKHPVYAIGGETTGTVVQSEKGAYELDLNGNKEWKKLAESLNNQSVMVAGTLNVRKGDEVKERRIITVTEFRPAAKQQ